jgi:hypothetical protein
LIEKGAMPSYISTSKIRLVSLILIGELNHYGKERFDSEGEEETKIGKKISFDSSILKKRNKQSSVIE